MERKLENFTEPGRPMAGAFALRISDWDEGLPQPNSWVAVTITYRSEDPSRAATSRRSLRVARDPAELPEQSRLNASSPAAPPAGN